MGIRTLRQDANLTLQGLADKSGVHYMKIHQIEKGKINIENITLRVALKLAEALECTPADLIKK